MDRGKRKKSKKSGMIALLILILLLAAGAGACYWYLPQAQAADENHTPVLEEGQEYTYARITSILGNEMEYVVVDAKTADPDKPQGQEDRRKERGESGKNHTASTQDTVIMTYTETDRTGQMQIPVGTEVETKLGAVTTFSRLSNGDIVKMLLQTDDTGNKTLMKMWIVE